jgi:glycosyltransferase involved in cell wall biosynthesis
LDSDHSINNISLIIPLWNEFSRGSFGYLDKLVTLSHIDFVFVNDGSTDDTLVKLEQYSELNNVQVINLEKNQGKTYAIKKGFQEAATKHNYDLVGFLDGDGAFEISEVIRCLTDAEIKIKHENFDIFCTSRVALAGHSIERDLKRHLLGRMIRTLIELRHKQLPYDTQSGFKLFAQNESFISTINREFQTRWFVDLEIILELRRKNPSLRIWEEPLLAWKDIGNSSISYSSFPLIVREIITLMRIKPSI